MAISTPQARLENNCWQANEDEFAVYLNISQLQGVFRKALQVPPAARAYVLQNGSSTEVPPGEYELEGFFSRLNHLLRDQQADILITRQAPFRLQFALSAIHSAEFLPLEIEFAITISIGQMAAFARHFMTAPGVITRADLQQLLAPVLRQIIVEFCAAQSLQEMAANPHLRLQLDERLQSMASMRLAQLGLALVQVETLQLSHAKLDAQRQKLASLSLLVDEKRSLQQQEQALQQLYDAQAWQQIQQQRDQIERDLQQQQMQTQASHDATLMQAEQNLQQDENLATLRARKIELLSRVLAADNEQQALSLGAKDALRALEHEMAGKAVQRLQGVDGWRQLRALAEIKMRTEREIASQQAREELALMQQRFALSIAKLQRAREHELAAGERSARANAQLDACEQQFKQAQQQARMALHQMQLAAKKQETERISAWQQQIALHKQRALLRVDALRSAEQDVNLSQLQVQTAQHQREIDAADSHLQHDKLRATLALQAQFQQQQQALRQQQQIALLDQQERSMHIAQQAAEQEWQRQQQAQAQEHAARAALAQAAQQQALEISRLEMTRIGLIGNLSDTAKLSVAAPANASLLAEVLKTQLHAGMQPAQIAASQGGVSASEAAQQIQQERAWREQLAERERQQQLDLLRIQQGVIQASKTCLHGHKNAQNAKFCVECGGALL